MRSPRETMLHRASVTALQWSVIMTMASSGSDESGPSESRRFSAEASKRRSWPSGATLRGWGCTTTSSSSGMNRRLRVRTPITRGRMVWKGR